MLLLHPQIFLDPSKSQMCYCFIHKHSVLRDFARARGEKRAPRYGKTRSEVQRAQDALGWLGKGRALRHCYFPTVSAWLETADRSFQGKGLNFLPALGFSGLPTLAPY